MGISQRHMRPGGVVPVGDGRGKQYLVTVTDTGLDRASPALVHEGSAWVRHGLRPSAPAVDAYLADVLPEGPVGGP